jgi:hypothetical protein
MEAEGRNNYPCINSCAFVKSMKEQGSTYRISQMEMFHMEI